MGGLTIRGPTVRSLVRDITLSPSPPCSPNPPDSPKPSERLLPRPRPLSAGPSALLNPHRTLIRAPRMRPGRPKTGVRLRRTWRVTGNMGLTYEV